MFISFFRKTWLIAVNGFDRLACSLHVPPLEVAISSRKIDRRIEDAVM
jgi:hypothetical protein